MEGAPGQPPLRAARVLVSLAVGLGVSGVFAWLVARRTDLGETWDVIRGADVAGVAAASACLLLVYPLQAARWRLVAGLPAPLGSYTALVVAGIACNNVLPARLGDVLRARWLAVATGAATGRTLATVIRDRVFDVAALLGFLLVTLPLVTEAAWARRIAVGGAILVVAVAVAFAGARAYARRRARARLARRSRLRRLARDTLDELAAPLPPARVAAALALSLAAWGVWASGAWVAADAVGARVSAAEIVFTAAVLNLGVAIPSSPGFVGTYQWLGVAALGAAGVAAEPALAFAILVHAAWFVPTTLVGGAAALHRGVVDALRRPRPGARARAE